MFTTPDKEGNCPDGYGLDPSGLCVRGRPATNADGCPAGWYRASINGIGLGCVPRFPLGCPVGTYFDEDIALCVAPEAATRVSLAGFHFDEALQCSLSDLPSGRYPGCPGGQAYDPSTGSCDFENIYVDAGMVLHTVEFDFSAPSCEANENSGDGDGGNDSGPPACSSYGDDATCKAGGCSWDGKVCS